MTVYEYLKNCNEVKFLSDRRTAFKGTLDMLDAKDDDYVVFTTLLPTGCGGGETTQIPLKLDVVKQAIWAELTSLTERLKRLGIDE